MNQRMTLLAGALLGGLGVAIGAFGAHGLKDILAETGRSETFELAVRYQFYHALAMLLVGVLMDRFPSRNLGWAALTFLLGVVFFSGSLYVLSLTGFTILGAVTPIGGVLFIAGWLLLFLGVWRR